MNVLEIIRFFNLKQVYCTLIGDMVNISTLRTLDDKNALHANIVAWFYGYSKLIDTGTKYYRLAFTDQGKLLFSRDNKCKTTYGNMLNLVYPRVSENTSLTAFVNQECLIFPSKEERTWENLHNEMIRQQKTNGMSNILKIILEHKIEKVYCPLLGEMIEVSILTEKCISAKVRFIDTNFYTPLVTDHVNTAEKPCVKILYFDQFGRLKGIDEAYRDVSYAECAIFPTKTERNWGRHNKILKGTARSTSLLEDETDLLELSL